MGGDTESTTEDGWFMTQIHLINDKLDVEEKYEQLKEFASQHPIYTLFIVVTIVTCSIPVIGFLTFLLGTVIFGFIGFVLFEGTVFIISSLVLGGVLCVTTVMAFSMSSFVVLTYYGVQLSQKLLRKTFPSLYEKFDNLKFEEKID